MATIGELTAGLIGGFAGGALGVLSTLVGSYYAPRKRSLPRSPFSPTPEFVRK